MVSLPVSGFLSDRVLRSRKKVVLTALVCFALLNLSIIFWTSNIPYWIVLASFFGLGFSRILNFSQTPPLQLEHLQLVLNSSTKNTL